MMNVLHLINYPGNGGSERYILSLAEKLNGKECRFFLAYSMDGPMLEQVKALGIEAYNIPMKSPLDLKAAMSVRNLCRELSIDIIHTHFLRENFIGIFSKLLGSRTVLVNTVHMMDRKSGITKLANRLFTRMDDRVIVVSDAVRRIQIAEGVDPGKNHLIHNGVNVACKHEKTGTSMREAFGIGGEEFVITSIARFTKEKGHFFLLDAIKRFKETYAKGRAENVPKVRFLLAGDGVLLDECKRRAENLNIDGDIVFAGFRKEVEWLLQESDLFISHSINEALGISILEALACGLPVVAANAGGPPEIVNEDTGCGILVEKMDTSGFAAAMSRMVLDREFYDRCRSNAVKTVETGFSLDKTSRDTFDLYSGCMKKG